MMKKKSSAGLDAAKELADLMRAAANPEKARHLQRFFKTGPGQYGEGDQFLGLTVPQTRGFIRQYRALVDISGFREMLASEWHEVRLACLLIMAWQAEKAADSGRLDDLAGLAHFYEKNLERVNNWDLIDLSAPHVLGRHWLESGMSDHDLKQRIGTLTSSGNLWRRRAGMLGTFAFIRADKPALAIWTVEQLLSDRHDLIHKAVGWMLREIGKRNDVELLRAFLRRHAGSMPRTALRYAIEHFASGERAVWMAAGPGSDKRGGKVKGGA